LGVALAASVATSRNLPSALFRGQQSLAVDPFLLDETHATRSWVITTDAVLPAEASDHDFTSSTGVQATVTAPDSVDSLVLLLSECGSDPVETTLEGVADIDDSFVDCIPGQTCTRRFCIEIANGNDPVVEVEWHTWTMIDSDATVDYDVDSIAVPIDITIEEIEQ
jgi:hypothetical protein